MRYIPEKTISIGIVGAGALGSLLGFYLGGAAGCRVWLIDGWAEHVAAIQSRGLACEREGQTEVRPVNATADPSAAGPCDMVLVLVKSHQTAAAAEQVRALLKGDKETRRQGDKEQPASRSPGPPVSWSDTLVVTLQNGLGNRELLAAALPGVQVIQGVTLLGATLLGPGRVRHAGMGPTYVHRGDAEDSQLPGLRGELVRLLSAAGLPAELRAELGTLVWGKLLVNAGINALTALLRVPNGALLAIPPARALMAELVAEAAAVARARGIDLPADPLAPVLAAAAATAANRSSMLQDVLRGSPTEIDVINGAIVREGQRLGVPTPTNRIITALVRAIEQREGPGEGAALPSNPTHRS